MRSVAPLINEQKTPLVVYTVAPTRAHLLENHVLNDYDPTSLSLLRETIDERFARITSLPTFNT